MSISTTELNEGSVDRSMRTAQARPEEHRHVHRSEVALARNANVFIWRQGPEAKLIACFNADVTQVAAETLLHWIGMPIALIRSGEITLNRIRLEHQGNFEYELVPLSLLETSEVLQAGSRRPRAILPPPGVKTFKQIREEIYQEMETTPTEDYPNGRRKWYELEASPLMLRICYHHHVQDDVRAEVKIPHNQCIFTGFTSSDTIVQCKADGGDTVAQDVTDERGAPAGPTTVAVAGSARPAYSESVDLRWILPTDMRDENGAPLFPRRVHIDSIPLTVAANVLPMCDTVHDLWFANEFSVDVDEGYRIYTFTDAAAKAGLPERLSLPAEEVASQLHDIYFREHLLHTRLMRVHGGAVPGVWRVDENAWEWYDEEEPEVDSVTDAMTGLQIAEDNGMPEWALERNANVFVWWPTGRLIACFNDAVTPVTVQTLLRWLGIPPSDDDETVIIKRVWLEHLDVTEYAPEPPLDSKPLESTSILTKGVYDCFVQDPIDRTRMPKTTPWEPIDPAGTLKLLQDTKIDQLSLYDDEAGTQVAKYVQNMKIPNVTREAFRGPRNICAFTGSVSGGENGAVDLHWIFPPYMFEKVRTGPRRSAELQSGSLPHRDIRTFTRAAVDIGLPERLSAKPEELELSERFFREHFFHTTLAWFRGGDIHKQDDIRDVKAAVIFHIHDLRDYGALFDPNDEIWKSEVGQDAFKLLGPEEMQSDSSRVSKGTAAQQLERVKLEVFDSCPD
ncbi:uncharacterized protein TRAVEDRAFT_23449 [Trametes versicolor FP-101664 SS1]|uniref:uncharacterized protein n=1 Tax=Trametes versicolor (strain FP-101664) TaxID=717944 RepID=UPI0004621932|nr:uncharacterized protein TRAVEDRAFT_23449 [Trametes versicolor FP-101664 SS1]EIW54351.1 hypothetical protein TRAVEDRAFT_23449 [Trametes versicolor FP-101664 SS1]